MSMLERKTPLLKATLVRLVAQEGNKEQELVLVLVMPYREESI